MGMKTQKLMPQQCKEIAARVKAGEKQVALASEFNVSEALISRVVKRERVKEVTPKPPATADFSSLTDEQLLNRYDATVREIGKAYEEARDTEASCTHLRLAIKSSTQRRNEAARTPLRQAIDAEILSYQKQLSYHEGTARKELGWRLMTEHQTLTSIHREMSARRLPIPRTAMHRVT